MLYGSWQIVVTVNTLLAPQNYYVQLFVPLNKLFARTTKQQLCETLCDSQHVYTVYTVCTTKQL